MSDSSIFYIYRLKNNKQENPSPIEIVMARDKFITTYIPHVKGSYEQAIKDIRQAVQKGIALETLEKLGEQIITKRKKSYENGILVPMNTMNLNPR